MLKRYLKEIEGGGSAAGNKKYEIASLDLKDAISFASKVFKENKKDLYTELPDFDKIFNFAKSKFQKGNTKRKDMPVIDRKDVQLFQHRLKSGMIDIKAPFSKNTDGKNPFPTSLSSKQAKDFLTNGLKDGNKTDDVVKVKEIKVSLDKLVPIQKQIYFDKSIIKIAENGIKGNADFINNKKIFIISSDYKVIDGHHALLVSMLNPLIKEVNCLMIDLDIDKLLPMSITYTSVIGNKRNK